MLLSASDSSLTILKKLRVAFELKDTDVIKLIEKEGTLKVTKSELKPTESTESKLWDRAAGQWHSSKGKIRIQGTLDFEINSMPFPGKLDLTIKG